MTTISNGTFPNVYNQPMDSQREITPQISLLIGYMLTTLHNVCCYRSYSIQKTGWAQIICVPCIYSVLDMSPSGDKKYPIQTHGP